MLELIEEGVVLLKDELVLLLHTDHSVLELIEEGVVLLEDQLLCEVEGTVSVLLLHTDHSVLLGT